MTAQSTVYFHLLRRTVSAVLVFSTLSAFNPSYAREVNCDVPPKSVTLNSSGKSVVSQSQKPAVAKAKRVNTRVKKMPKRTFVSRTKGLGAAASNQASLYPARILALHGRVMLVGQAGLVSASPRMLKVGDAIHLGDVVQTAQQSFVSMRLGDGVISVLPSSSTIELSKTRENVARYVLRKGVVESDVPKRINSKSNTFEIETSNSIIGVRGTHFRVQQDEASGRVSAEVEEGQVWLTAKNICAAPLILTEGTGAMVDVQSLSVTSAALLNPPQLQNSNQAQSKKQLAFRIASVEGAVRYHAQIAKDLDFLDIQQEVYSDTPELHFDEAALVNGFYYLKLTAIDAQGIEGKSDVSVFLRAHNDKTWTSKNE